VLPAAQAESLSGNPGLVRWLCGGTAQPTLFFPYRDMDLIAWLDYIKSI
jgi:hypothetical protein